MKKQLLIGLMICVSVALVVVAWSSIEKKMMGGDQLAVRIKPVPVSGQPAIPLVIPKAKMIAADQSLDPKLQTGLQPLGLPVRDLPEVHELTLNLVARYHVLQAKIFQTQAESLEREQILGDPEALKNLKDLLLRAEPEEFERDLVAMDILVDSLAKANPSARQQVEALIFDPQIESAKLSSEEQQYLAEVKGEMIYHWIAYEPDRINEIESKLPGPISRRLLENAKQIRQANLQESSLEL